MSVESNTDCIENENISLVDNQDDVITVEVAVHDNSDDNQSKIPSTASVRNDSGEFMKNHCLPLKNILTQFDSPTIGLQSNLLSVLENEADSNNGSYDYIDRKEVETSLDDERKTDDSTFDEGKSAPKDNEGMSETAADNKLADNEKHEGDNQFDLPENDITNDEIESVAISGDITMCDNDDVIVESTNDQLGESNDDNEDEGEPIDVSRNMTLDDTVIPNTVESTPEHENESDISEGDTATKPLLDAQTVDDMESDKNKSNDIVHDYVQSDQIDENSATVEDEQSSISSQESIIETNKDISTHIDNGDDEVSSGSTSKEGSLSPNTAASTFGVWDVKPVLTTEDDIVSSEKEEQPLEEKKSKKRSRKRNKALREKSDELED